MPPILYVLHLPGGTAVPLYTYGVMRAAAIVLGVFVARAAFRRRGQDPDHIFWAAIWVTPVALFGATMFGIGGAVAAAVRTGAPLAQEVSLALSAGGTYLLALPMAAVAFAAYARFYGLPVGTSLDAMALAIAAVMPVQRLGCFAAGCCYGKATDLPWGVVYTTLYRPHPAVAPLDVSIHPTQLYEAVLVGALFVGLARLFAQHRPPGAVLLAFLGGYGVIRFLVEILRDNPRLFLWVGGPSLAQGVCLLAVLVGVAGWRGLIHKRR